MDVVVVVKKRFEEKEKEYSTDLNNALITAELLNYKKISSLELGKHGAQWDVICFRILRFEFKSRQGR